MLLPWSKWEALALGIFENNLMSSTSAQLAGHCLSQSLKVNEPHCIPIGRRLPGQHGIGHHAEDQQMMACIIPHMHGHKVQVESRNAEPCRQALVAESVGKPPDPANLRERAG